MTRLMPAISDATSFEALFCIPQRHQLVLVRSRSRGGLASRMSWGHEEYDTTGQLVARYESLEETGAAGEQISRWRRFNPQGEVTAEENAGSALGEDSPAPDLNSAIRPLARQAQ